MAADLGIDAATWRRISPLLDAALELPPARRQAWLAALSGPDKEARPLLATLLARAERVDSAALLEALPAIGATDGGRGGDAAHHAGKRIGPYRLLRPLGTGGMGAVWLAERADGTLAQRQVALKLPFGPFGHSHPDLAARIDREREILATLDHPHIARLYDAGVTDDGQPYMALEYVAGQRIDHHCTQHGLGIPARLRLFLQVARAVAHAHAQLVVHRDLKPSNLLVDAAGQAKLLDFGIARLLHSGVLPASDLTQQGMRLLTPEYAAPEQVAGQPVGTRSDVYALGVLLFELLCGQRPYRLKRDSRAALEEAVLHADVPRPSDVATDAATRRALRGDLDTIVQKALKKAVAERYASVDAMAEDIERHLDSRPVLARPDGWRYRTRKFIVRNRLGVGTAALLLTTVMAGAGSALWQARVAIAERQRAETVKDFITAIFSEASPYTGIGTKDLLAVDLLKQADTRLQAAAIGAGSVRVELTNTIAASLLGLGDVAAAEPIVHRAVAEAAQALAPLHPQGVRALYLRSQVHRMRGRPQQAAADIDRVLPTLRARAGDAEGVANLADALLHRTGIAIDLGAYAEAERFALEGFELTQTRLGELDRDRVDSAMMLAQAYRQTRKFDLALPSAERAYRDAITVYGDAQPGRRMSEARNIYARALADTGDLARGIALLEKSVADTRALLGPRSQTAGIFLQNLVAYRMDLGQLEQARADATEAVDILAITMLPDAPALSIARHSLAAVELARHDAPAALATATRAAAVLDRTIGAAHENAVAARTTMALALLQAGRLDEAAREIDAVSPRVAGISPSSPQVARVALARGTLERLRGDSAAALQHLRGLAESVEPAPKWQRERMRAAVQIGHAQLDQGLAAAAAATLVRALQEFDRLETQPTPARADALLGLGRAYLALGDGARAVPLLQQASDFWRGFEPAHPAAAAAGRWLARARTAPRG